MRIWVALIVAPLLAIIDQSVAFALVGWSCAHQTTIWIHVTHAAFLVAAGLCAGFAWPELRRTEAVAIASTTISISQRRFLAGIAASTAVISTLAIAAMWLPTWMIAPCVA